MKISVISASIMAVLMFGVMTSCKKPTTTTTDSTLDANVDQQNKDGNDYKSQMDQADNDINSVLRGNSTFNKTEEGFQIAATTICGCTIDSVSGANDKIIYFSFNDAVATCLNSAYKRSGNIKVQLTTGQQWNDAGSVITETFTDYKITHISSGRYIMFNGVKTLKNVNGLDWLQVYYGNPVTYQERAFNVDVKFNNNGQAIWNSARRSEWSYVSATGAINFKAYGDTTVNGFANTDTWGLTRINQPFTTYYNTPIQSNTTCGLWKFKSGELVCHVNNANYTLTLGVNQDGTAASASGCAYGYKVAWDFNGTANNAVFAY